MARDKVLYLVGAAAQSKTALAVATRRVWLKDVDSNGRDLFIVQPVPHKSEDRAHLESAGLR